MKKYLFIVAILFTTSLSAFTQNIRINELDSLSIDNLKKALPSLKDSAKVDCLNQIAMEYNYYSAPELKAKMDSTYYYASEANKVATKIGYKKGIAFSLVNLSRTQLFANKNIPAAEKYLREAILIGESINNPDILGWAYYKSGDIDQTKNKSQDALEKYRKAIKYFQISGNEDAEAEVSNWLCTGSISEGKYEDGFSYCERCEALSKKTRSNNVEFGHFLREFALYNMGELYKAAGDYETGMSYYQQARKQALLYDIKWGMEIEIGELFCNMGQYDSAFFYIRKYTNAFPKQTWAAAVLGETYLMKKQYATAIKIFRECIYGDQFREYNIKNKEGLKRAFLFAGKAYAEKKNYSAALKYTKEGLELAKKDESRPLLIEGYESLSTIYYHLGISDSAYKYLLKYTTLKDSVLNRQFFWRLNNYKKAAEDAKKESRIGFLNRDNKIKQQQLKQQVTFRNFLIAIFIAIIFAGLFVFRNIILKRKNEKLQQQQKEQQWKLKELESENKHVEIQKQSAELEMQALRAQMNPHFIFNSLSSINHFILKNESKIASNYLTRFSRLIRMVLINSQKPLIALEDELQMLELYLEMERLRFKSSFDYAITFLNTIDSDNIFIPPLLLQPFCENAIWHGLMHLSAGQAGKEGAGRLDIELSMQDKILNCIITDNGVGREKAEEMKSKNAEKEKSMGLRITTERLALLNREKGLHTFYEIEDLIGENGNAAGTKVTLKIRFKESIEEPV